MTFLVAALAVAAPPVELLVRTGGPPGGLVLAVEVDGRPHAALWGDAVAALFADADADGNGVIDEREARRVPSALRVRQLGWGYLWAGPEPAQWRDLSAGGPVGRDSLAAYYRRHLADGPQIGIGQAPPAAALTDALVKRIAGKDGRLNETEWKNVEAALRPLDANDDELIQPGELVPRIVYPGSAGGLMLPPPDTKSLPKLLAEFPVTRRAAADPSPGAITLTVRLGTRKPGEEDVARSAADPAGVRVLAYTAASSLVDDFAAARKAARDRFAAADVNGDGALDASEVKAAGYAPLRDHFAAADRDGDGRLTRAEWEAYLAVRAAVVAAQVSVTLFDHGHGLFETIDADGDAALSVREQRTAWPRLVGAGCVRDGRLDADKLPRTIRVVVARGRPGFYARVPPRAGPDWFRAMDRNRDGDVSRREFVGTDAAFRQLDADGDGLISAAEAAAAKK